MMSILQEAFPTIITPPVVVMVNYFICWIVLADSPSAGREIVRRVQSVSIYPLTIPDLKGLLRLSLLFS